MKAILLVIFLTATRVCAGEFPIGLYGVSPDLPLKLIAEACFTHILPASRGHEDQQILISAARAASLRVVGFPDAISSVSGPLRVSAWYVSDEPDINNETPEAIRRQADGIRRKDPHTPLVLVVGEGRRAAEYAESVDAVMVDWYPVPHLPLASLGDEIGTAVSQVPNRPIWAVVQSMDWRDYPQRDSNKPRIGRFPTQGELRFMAFHSVVRGASGVFFFKMSKNGHQGITLLNSPEHWQALRSVTRELGTLRPFFEASNGERLTLEGLEGRRWRKGGRELVILLNNSSLPVTLPAAYQSGRFKTLFEAQLRPSDALPAGRLHANQVFILIASKSIFQSWP